MAEKEAISTAGKIILLVVFVLILFIIASVIISPRISAQQRRTIFTQACFEWYKKGCKIEDFDNIQGLEYCSEVYPAPAGKTSEQVCQEICLNGCSPM